MNANLVVALSLISAVFAVVKLRSIAPRLVIGSVALFVLTAAQTVIGHQITDENRDWLLAIHIPLAFLIFSLLLWLLAQVAFLWRRQASRSQPSETSSVEADQ